MAEPGDRSRRSSSDTDGRPGNSSDSPQYSRIYDRRAESEFSGRLETTSQLRAFQAAEQIRREQNQAREAAREAQSRVHVFPSVGKFIIPAENTWAAHAQLIHDKAQNLYFNPKKFVHFDKIIADRLGMPALTDEKHPDYPQWEGLRNNLAVLRNDIIGIYLRDGSFDPGDEVHLPKIQSIAGAIGEALAGDRWYKRLLTRHLSLDVANVESVGAREIYDYLLSSQSTPIGKLEGIRSRFNDMLGLANRAWGLPPIEHTPFSDANLSAPPPVIKQCFTEEEIQRIREEDNDRILEQCRHTAKTACGLQSVDAMAPPAKTQSVDEARRILRWLRNLRFSDKPVEEFITHGTPREQDAKISAISRLVDLYAERLHTRGKQQPDILDGQGTEDARSAAGALSAGMALFALHLLPDGHPGIAALERSLDGLPRAWERRETEPTRRLLDALEDGFAQLERPLVASAKGRSPAQDLAAASEGIERKARALREVSDLEPPTREESVELAREILRRLREMRFSDQPVEEMAKHASAEEKAAFARQMDEMVSIYQNLLFEAAAITPGLLADPLLREASDAVGGLSHGIKLMAAKEMPGSIAAAQQIAADITQTPERWSQLSDRTISRLLQSMEGALEKAVSSLETTDQDEERAEEASREATETALLNSDQARRKRRRRRKQQGTGGAKQRKTMLDINADDYVLKQGRFRERGGAAHDDDGPSPAHTRRGRAERTDREPVHGTLKAEDLAAVKELGSVLRGAGQQAREIEIPALGAAAPDDRSAAQRMTDRDQHAPKHQGPRV